MAAAVTLLVSTGRASIEPRYHATTPDPTAAPAPAPLPLLLPAVCTKAEVDGATGSGGGGGGGGEGEGEGEGKVARRKKENAALGLVRRLTKRTLSLLSNLPLAISEMFAIAALMALGDSLLI